MFAILFDLYILADRFDVKALRVRVIDHLQGERDGRPEGLGNLIPLNLVKKAFENLPEQSPLCRWLIYVFGYDWNPALDSAERAGARKDLPKDFIMQVMLLYGGRLHCPQYAEHRMVEPELCTYHEHETYQEVIACRQRRRQTDNGSWTLISRDFNAEDEVQPHDARPV